MERIYIRDRNLNTIAHYSALRDLDFSTNLTFDTMWGRGYGPCSFRVRRDIVEYWAVKSAYDLIIRDGHTIIYQGILQGLNKSLHGLDSVVDVQALGPYSILAQRNIRKRWADNDPYSRFYWPSGRHNNGAQNAIHSTIEGNLCRVRLPGQAVSSSNGDEFHFQYDGIPGDVIIKVDYDYTMESGNNETFQLITYNVDQTTAEDTLSFTSNTSGSGSKSITFTAGDTDSIQMRWRIHVTDGDADGIGTFRNMIVYAELSTGAGVPNYYADDIIKDILNLKGNSEISVDYDQVGSPAFALIPFTTRSDDFETCDSVIQRAVNYGDGSQNTWGFQIWDKEFSGLASDGLPKAELIQRAALTDYDYFVELGELADFSDEESFEELYNYIQVKFDDADGKTSFVDPDDDANLKDTTSITDYGQRDKVLYIGKSTTAKATEYGERYLALHKDPLRKAGLSVVGSIRKKGGVRVPVNRVRSGKRVKVMDYDGGTTFFLQRTSYNAETKVMRMEPDLPPDNLAILMSQREDLVQ